MSEYINREATRHDAFCEGVSCQDCPFCKDPVQGGCRIDDFVKSIPAADAVEVVRCGECKHYNDKLEMYFDYVCTIRHYCDGSPIIVGKDDFCSSGKRKEGGQDDV